MDLEWTLSKLGRGDCFSGSLEGMAGVPDVDDRDGETSFGLATEGVGVFDCRLDQKEKKPPDGLALVGESASACCCFSTIRQPTGTTSSSITSFRCLIAVSQAVEPRAAR